MGEDLAKYLVDADEPSSTKKVVVRRTKPKPKTKTYGVSGWDGGYSKPKTYTRPKGDTGTGASPRKPDPDARWTTAKHSNLRRVVATVRGTKANISLRGSSQRFCISVGA